MKRIAVLGSTGSIGQSTLSLIKALPGRFCVVAMSTNSNVGLLSLQAKIHRPQFVCVSDTNCGKGIRRKFSSSVRVLTGADGLLELCKNKQVDMVVMAITGSYALAPLLEAIENGKEIALANKEALVMAGELLMQKARAHRARIIPIDSEQSAIWQCLQGQEKKALKTVYLTASGGPFRNVSYRQLKEITPKQALRHPRWKMGRKISVDSATLMNKGLEVLEAIALFDLAADKIKVLIHPESVVHSMVEFVDGSILAQLSATDMRIPIQYALTYPQRLPGSVKGVDFFALKHLNFQKPDFKKFPCLSLAYRAARQSGTAPCVLNAANEIAVEAFLKGALSFTAIPALIEKVLDAHRRVEEPSLIDIREADYWAKAQARKAIYHG